MVEQNIANRIHNILLVPGKRKRQKTCTYSIILMWNSAGGASTPTSKKKISRILQNLRYPFCGVCKKGVNIQKDIANSAEFVILFVLRMRKQKISKNTQMEFQPRLPRIADLWSCPYRCLLLRRPPILHNLRSFSFPQAVLRHGRGLLMSPVGRRASDLDFCPLI